jgi:Ca2+-binding EF-hand superfamily protein
MDRSEIAPQSKKTSFTTDVQRRSFLPIAKMFKAAKGFFHSLLSFIGRLAARLPTRILRIFIGGFVKELKRRQLSLEELHYILMDDININDIYRLVINERSLNLTTAEYGGIVNFLDAKAKLEASKIIPELDRDKDGKVSPEEVLRFVSESVSSQLSGAIETLDANGDGRLTPSDFFHLLSDRMRDAVFQPEKNTPPPRS